MKRKKLLHTISVLFMTIFFLLISSCEKEEPEPELLATSIQLVTGGSQTANAGSALANPVELIVKDQDGSAFAGTKVSFSVTEGAVSGASGTTDKDGKVTVNWTLGTTAGAQILIATAFKADGTTQLTGSPLSITATAIEVDLEATSLSVFSGNEQNALVEATLTKPVIVIVRDQNDSVFSGANVSFSVSEGSVSSPNIITGANGQASIYWTLGSSAGEQTLMATAYKADGTTALSGSPLSITATAVAFEASRVGLISGNNQTGFVEETLSKPIKIMVQNQKGEGFPGTPVHFSVSEGSVSSETIVTDANGYASAEWTLGSTLGTQTLTVTAFQTDGTTPLTGSPIEVSATGEGAIEATSIELVSGGDQTGQTLNTLAEKVRVIVKDQNGNGLTLGGLDACKVYFSVDDGGVNPYDWSNGAGEADTYWVLGSIPGIQTLTITAFKADGTTHLSGSPLTVDATAVGVSTIELFSGGDQEVVIGGELSNPIEVIVKDESGNPYRNSDVSYTVTEGSVSSASESTDASGIASVNWSLGATVGTQTLTVTAYQEDGTTPLTGSPLSITATGLAPPPQDPVTDYDGNVYQTVKIGDQIWMAENLKVTHYADGAAIPYVTDDAAWAALEDNGSDKAYCYNNNDPESDYGALYTWAAAMNGAASSGDIPSGVQGVCPAGWHMPSNQEWSALWVYYGTKANAGSFLKETGTTHWNSPNTDANNLSGFTALGGGQRLDDGSFKFLGEYAMFWASREELNYNLAITFRLYYSRGTVYTNGYYKSGGLSVRCVKDE